MKEKLEEFKKELLSRIRERDKDAQLHVKLNQQSFTGSEYIFQMTSKTGQQEYFSVILEPYPRYIRVFYV